MRVVDVAVPGVGVVRRLFASTRGQLPLVLVPGCGCDHHAFDALLEELSLHDVEVLVPALPGRAGIAGCVTSASSSSAYVLRLLAALGIGRAVVGGHSWGGAVAQELALDDVDGRIAGLVLLSTGARLRVAQAMLDAVEASGDLVALADWRACHRFDRLADVARIQVPTVVVVGADDVLTPPRYGQFLHERIAGSSLVLLEGAGHEAPTTHAVAVATSLLPLLRRVAGGVGSSPG